MLRKLLFILLISNCSIAIVNADWVQVTNGIVNPSAFYALAKIGNNIFAGRLNYGVYISTNNGENWTQTSLSIQVFSLAVSGIYLFAGGPNGVYKTSDNGAIWNQTSLNNRAVQSLEANENIIFAGTTSYGVYKSTDNSTTWIQTVLNNQSVNGLAANGNNIFAGTGSNGVYKSTNNGENWIQTVLNNRAIYAIEVNMNYVFAGTVDYGVYISTDSGTSWAQTSLNNQSVVALEVTGNNIYAGTLLNGVYVSNDHGTTWYPRNEGLGNQRIESFCILNNYIFAGTFGNSIYRRPLGELTAIHSVSNEIPGDFKLHQNYPNPFNPTTKIKFEIPNSKSETNSKTEIRIYDVLGKEAAILVNDELKPGVYEVYWDASDYPSGVYYYQLTVSSEQLTVFKETKKMVMVK